MSKIYIFTIDECENCLSLKNKLNNMSIPFIDLPIYDNPIIWNRVKTLTGYDYIPTIFILDNDNEPHIFIPELDFKSEEEIINIIKEYS